MRPLKASHGYADGSVQQKGKGKAKDDKNKTKAEKANDELPAEYAMERRAARVVAEEAMKYSGESGRCPLPGCDSKGN